jgi:hypothetical protein
MKAVMVDIPIWRFRLDYASAKIYAKLSTARNTRWEEPLKLLSGINGRTLAPHGQDSPYASSDAWGGDRSREGSLLFISFQVSQEKHDEVINQS